MFSARSAFPFGTRLPYWTLPKRATLCNFQSLASAPCKRGISLQPSKPLRVKNDPWRQDRFIENDKLTQLRLRRGLGITFIPASDKLLAQQCREEQIKRGHYPRDIPGKGRSEAGFYVSSAVADLFIKKTPSEVAKEQWFFKVNKKYYCMEPVYIEQMYRFYGEGDMEPQGDIDLLVEKYINEYLKKKDKDFRGRTTQEIIELFRGPQTMEIA
ncbi:hypothetical protein FVEG_16845 [Fusarium verticillioides 7600]|uniref:Uncharacterized protein n=1 Tax=Gibberella moniliformis (strain M3125 / FGSC 7600) TaxID=334819 RepID=W7MVB4_GIBM7|nr:hypothetical protein FVEG_16845 [Fusarium verticillioides 7600]EWG51739.1 hypothetical protein FVEG_16845 [Fusarium verticillioides 7600]